MLNQFYAAAQSVKSVQFTLLPGLPGCVRGGLLPPHGAFRTVGVGEPAVYISSGLKADSFRGRHTRSWCCPQSL